MNPFGTLYNPLSVAEVLTRLLDRRSFDADEIEDFGSEGHGSWLSHSLLSKPSRDEALAVLNDNLERASKQVREAGVLIITFGTAWVYRLKETGAVVANCHHEAATRFTREALSVDEVVATWQPMLERLRRECPDLHVLFTVSPIRHLRDGAHANQLSKATLLLAVDKLTAQHANATYFPAYEIVLDELRDYRFFAEDMTHPSSLAVDYLWERFADTYFDAKTKDLSARVENLAKALEHRPLHPDSDEFYRFQQTLSDKIEALKRAFPDLKTTLFCPETAQ